MMIITPLAVGKKTAGIKINKIIKILDLTWDRKDILITETFSEIKYPFTI